jgi:hypothetical protein
MTVNVTMLQTRRGEGGVTWEAGETYASTEGFAKFLVGCNLATATFDSTDGFVQASGQISGAGVFNLVGPDNGVLAQSEAIPEVLATASDTTTVLTGAGLYAGYRCTTAAGNITVYDNTAASGKVLVPTTALAVGAFPAYGAGHNGRLVVATGVTVVLSGAAVVYAGVEGD